MNIWTALLDLLILLTAAMVLGTICERLKQSAILGYLIAGTLLGPNALNMMPNHAAVSSLAELGVALLLFTIGLEFSWNRLRKLGPIALGGGSLQVLITTLATASVCAALGLGWRAGLAIGAMVALSSTTCVLRLLVNRFELESVHGRNALGILLLQDVAVVPMVLLVTVLARGGTTSEVAWEVTRALGAAILLMGSLFVLLNYLLPPRLGAKALAGNRDLPTLLAVITAIGSAWSAHQLGLSPALGAFVAGLLLAESPFATQIRSEVGSLKTLFVTIFFGSIGMLGDPVWAASHWMQIVAVVSLIIVGKSAVTSSVALLFRFPIGASLATGICLAQVGEFSFVLSEVAHKDGLIDDDLFRLIISATIVTLFVTPYLVALAPRISLRVHGIFDKRASPTSPGDIDSDLIHPKLGESILIVGFGPAGKRAAELLQQTFSLPITIIELQPATASLAERYGFKAHVGDATRTEILEHAGIANARAVIVTIPDPASSRSVISLVRSLAPEAFIVARARYHMHREALTMAGANVAIDEEEIVGEYLAKALESKWQNNVRV